MKRFLFFALLAALMVSTGCSDDDEPRFSDGVLRYDGPNASGPSLNAGGYEAAARFPADVTSLEVFTGRRLTQVQWFMGFVPEECQVKIYGNGADDQPGSLLYEANVLSSVTAGQFTTHTLTTPIDLTGEDLWISIAFRHGTTMQSIGCDAQNSGVTNGDWLFSGNDARWLPWTTRTNGVDRINWNIRGITE
ncbi:MAG: hypothetical protein AAGG75_13635 [Bacteroidota bacterium]